MKPVPIDKSSKAALPRLLGVGLYLRFIFSKSIIALALLATSYPFFADIGVAELKPTRVKDLKTRVKDRSRIGRIREKVGDKLFISTGIGHLHPQELFISDGTCRGTHSLGIVAHPRSGPYLGVIKLPSQFLYGASRRNATTTDLYVTKGRKGDSKKILEDYFVWLNDAVELNGVHYAYGGPESNPNEWSLLTIRESSSKEVLISPFEQDPDLRLSAPIGIIDDVLYTVPYVAGGRTNLVYKTSGSSDDLEAIEVFPDLDQSISNCSAGSSLLIDGILGRHNCTQDKTYQFYYSDGTQGGSNQIEFEDETAGTTIFIEKDDINNRFFLIDSPDTNAANRYSRLFVSVDGNGTLRRLGADKIMPEGLPTLAPSLNIMLNGILYFFVRDLSKSPFNGQVPKEVDVVEFWRSDGTEEGTFMLKRIEKLEVDYTNIYGAISALGRLYFSIQWFPSAPGGARNDVPWKSELWESDGTIAGTKVYASTNEATQIELLNGLQPAQIGYRGYLYGFYELPKVGPYLTRILPSGSPVAGAPETSPETIQDSRGCLKSVTAKRKKKKRKKRRKSRRQR